MDIEPQIIEEKEQENGEEVAVPGEDNQQGSNSEKNDSQMEEEPKFVDEVRIGD